MRVFIRQLSPITEFTVVVAIAFGLWLSQGPAMVALRLSSSEPLKWPPFTNTAVLGLIGIELVILAAVSAIGRMRGWTLLSFGGRVSWKLTLFGIALVLLVQLPASLLLRDSFSVFSGAASIFVIVPLLAINAFFEESLEVGYVFHTLSRYGLWLPVVVSLILRASLHLYLSGVAFVAVLAGGILYAIIYAKLKQLWPLVLAHFVMGLIFLWPFVRIP